MKKTMKGLMVMSAVLSSFFMAQVVAAETVEGIVRGFVDCPSEECTGILVERCTAEPRGNSENANIFIECSGEYATVVGLRTSDYWENYDDGVDFPAMDDYVNVEAELQPSGFYFANNMEVCEVDDHDNFVTCDYIELHDADEAL
ncbi:MAG: hypothetical protein KJ717_02205 [Proteobacteria bacterium]|nr:hypothetical protein [Pseudomonadota bacterium]